MLTIPHISVVERGITITWISLATGHMTVGGIVRLRVSDAKRDVERNRRINMEYCRIYKNDGKIKGVAVELSLAECRVVMDALKDHATKKYLFGEYLELRRDKEMTFTQYVKGARDMLNGLKKACGGADEQEE